MGYDVQRDGRRALSYRGAMPRALTVGALAIAVAIGYWSAMKNRSTPLKEAPAPQVIVKGSASTGSDSVRPSGDGLQSAPSPEPNADRGQPIKLAIADLIALFRTNMLDTLESRGLSRTDGERVVDRYIEGFAGCVFEAGRMESERNGMSASAFLDAAELDVTRALQYFGSKKVLAAAAPCMTVVSQQAGVSLPPGFGSNGTDIDRLEEASPSPPWAVEMETRIRDHVASSPVSVDRVLARCTDDGCSVTLIGRDIRVYEMGFDVFAEQNGFQHAVPRGDGNARFIWLQR